MAKPKNPFKLPKSFLTQLGEFTSGYHLVIVNDKQEFETYSWSPSKVIELAMLNYIDIQSTAVQEIIRQRTIDRDLSNNDEQEPPNV